VLPDPTVNVLCYQTGLDIVAKAEQTMLFLVCRRSEKLKHWFLRTFDWKDVVLDAIDHQCRLSRSRREVDGIEFWILVVGFDSSIDID
jgi:hypothetical protein